MSAKSKASSNGRLLVIADAICDLAKDIGARRGKPAHIPQWVMVSDIARLLDGHGTGITAAELQAAIVLARRRRILQVEGEPAHSVAPHQGWDGTGRPVKIRLR